MTLSDALLNKPLSAPRSHSEPLVAVREVKGKGRGVFALHALLPGTVVDYAPVTPIPVAQNETLKPTVLDDYLFFWQPDGEPLQQALVFGLASFINHHHNPNCIIGYDYPNKHIFITTKRQIAMGEEITIDYDCDLWFPYQP
jgi:uncharacterized protein